MNEKITVALAGNPNVGKSTVFNCLTGMKQHTGNWTGKTVDLARCSVQRGEITYDFVDIPGTYSLKAHSKEEEIADKYICYGDAQKVVVVCDGSNLGRNLYLALQILETGARVYICVNLLDEAKKQGININLKLLAHELGVPVSGTVAKKGRGVENIFRLMEEKNEAEPLKIKYPEAVEKSLEYIMPALLDERLGGMGKKWLSLRLLENDKTAEEFLKCRLEAEKFEKVMHYARKGREYFSANSDRALNEIITESIYEYALEISRRVTVKTQTNESKKALIDIIFQNQITAYLLMFALLFGIFFLTVWGANYPSQLLSAFFSNAERWLFWFFNTLNIPSVLTGVLLKGGFRVLGWVVAVMLPPMAIFFPLFTFLEELGILPRVAYVLDNGFHKVGSCGKQALTVAMGYGCNCVGVTGARIIDSKKERLCAILTNTLTPCNGRFPAILKLCALFFVAGANKTLKSAFSLSLIIVISLFLSLLLSSILNRTVLKGEGSHYILEIPPLRVPRMGKLLYRSVTDRTLFVLGRSVVVAFPAGILIYLLLNSGLIKWLVSLFSPLGILMGLDGEILTGFVLGIPANEIVLPIILMCYSGAGELSDVNTLGEIGSILFFNGWTPLTAVCFIAFSVVHFPCATTLMTIYKETGSIKYTLLSFALPTAMGVIICTVINLFSAFVRIF